MGKLRKETVFSRFPVIDASFGGIDLFKAAVPDDGIDSCNIIHDDFAFIGCAQIKVDSAIFLNGQFKRKLLPVTRCRKLQTADDHFAFERLPGAVF